MTDGFIYRDSDLLLQLAKGDAGAMSVIYDTYAKGLFNSAFNVLKDRAACEDLVQEIFLSLWMKRESLVITTSLKAYLYAAVRFQVFRIIRQEKGTSSLFEQLEERIWGEPNPENLLYQKELQARIHRVADELPPRCREIYRLSREEQLSHKEIARRLNITVKAVEFQITISLKKIREALPELMSLIILWLAKK